MCILFLAVEQHSEYPLIIAANRDEYYARASKPMHWWDDHPGILAGRDLVAGGTWLGVNRSGEFAAVTNFRDPSNMRSDARSRGSLPISYLERKADYRDESDAGFGQRIAGEHTEYNPFNLVYGDQGSLYAYNHGDRRSTRLEQGCHSISNGHMDTPWPKMSRGVGMLQELVQNSNDFTPSSLASVMQDTQPAPDDQLPETGLTPDRERALSSIFIQGDDYGTRTTTILLFSATTIEIMEINYGHNGHTTNKSDFSFDLTT